MLLALMIHLVVMVDDEDGQNSEGCGRQSEKVEATPSLFGPVANPNTKLLIYGLFQRGRVLAQDGEPESPTSPPTRPRTGARHKSMTIETARRASLEFVCVFGQDGSVLGWLESTCCRTFIATSLGHLVDFDNSKADSQ